MKKKLLFLPLTLLVLASCDFAFASINSEEDISSATSQLDSTSTEGSIIDDSTSSVPTSDDKERAGFSLLWEDEFTTASLDTNNWSYMFGNGADYGIVNWGNNEAQWYKRENATIRDGKLVITAAREQVGGYQYTSARIRTAGKISTTYGRIEARMSLPEVDGMWPAFWMLPEDNFYGGWPYSGEIDIMENRGREYDITSGALHFGAPHQYISRNRILRDDTISVYHTYALEWEETEMRWYVDDFNFMTITEEQWFSSTANETDNPYAPFDQDFHILLNMAVGGNFSGGVLPPDDFEFAEMLIEYVRIYQAE